MRTTAPAGGTTFAMPSDREIVATRVLHAPRALVWEAFAEPRHVASWLLGPDGWTMPVCEIDLRPGGAWHFVWQGPGDGRLEMRGVYREVDPPERLVQTGSWGPGWPETLETLVLSETDGKTTLTCTVRYPSEAARAAALATRMTDGWSASYDRLQAYLATDTQSRGRSGR